MTPRSMTRDRAAPAAMAPVLAVAATLLVGALGCDGGGKSAPTTEGSAPPPPMATRNGSTALAPTGPPAGRCTGFDLYTADQVILHGIGLNARAAIIVNTGRVDRYGVQISVIAIKTMGGQIAVVATTAFDPVSGLDVPARIVPLTRKAEELTKFPRDTAPELAASARADELRTALACLRRPIAQSDPDPPAGLAPHPAESWSTAAESEHHPP